MHLESRPRAALESSAESVPALAPPAGSAGARRHADLGSGHRAGG
jgi:hypothetical protein